MKKEYKKPELKPIEYATFENVFAKCNKTQSGGTPGSNQDCDCIPGWPPSGEYNASFGGQLS
jgi:hypothetical protein